MHDSPFELPLKQFKKEIKEYRRIKRQFVRGIFPDASLNSRYIMRFFYHKAFLPWQQDNNMNWMQSGKHEPKSWEILLTFK